MDNIKATEAAKLALEHNLPVTKIKEMIPKYENPLPRRAWIRRFMDAIPETSRKAYSDLK